MSNKDIKEGKLSKRLTADERQRYKSYGEVDPTQNWLELFTRQRMADLNTIMHTGSDNQAKCDMVTEELSYLGFEPVGLGTNIYTMANPAYPGVVFKIALDYNGLADNFNDEVIGPVVNEILGRDRYTKVLARHPSGIISVQERKVVIKTQDRMDQFRRSIMKSLRKLSRTFLIVDLAPSLYPLNYGVDRNGDWCFIDASDLYPVENIGKKYRTCNYNYRLKNDDEGETRVCGGTLTYTPDFAYIVCEKCGRKRLPLEIRPNDKKEGTMNINAMFDGTTEEERETMRKKEIVRIAGKVKEIEIDVPDAPVTTPVKAAEPITEPEKPITETPAPLTPQRTAPMNIFVKHQESLQVRPNASFRDLLADEDEENEPDEKAPAKEPEEEESNDDDEFVEILTRDPMVPSSTPPKEEEDDEDDLIEAMTTTPAPVPHIEYSIDTSENGGIMMNVIGDPKKAMARDMLPIQISVDNGKTWYTGITSTGLQSFLEAAIEDIEDDI